MVSMIDPVLSWVVTIQLATYTAILWVCISTFTDKLVPNDKLFAVNAHSSCVSFAYYYNLQ